MYLIDTNVISMLDARRRDQAQALVGWLERNGGSLFISVMTISAMDVGALKLRRDGKHDRANEIAALIDAIAADFADRILPMDLETSRHVARLAAATYQQPVALPDLIIAATAVRHGLTVLTRNLKDFARVQVRAVDPFEQLPADL